MKTFTFLILLLSGFVTLAQTDEDNVKAVIEKAYVGGIHNGGPVADIRAGFHPSFSMYVLNNDVVKVTSIEEWIGNIEKGRAQNPNASPTKASAKFISAIVTGSSASVTLELYRNDKKIFTDNLLLYKFPEGWRIVAKTFYRHPVS